jgi:hypothetical protein
MAELWPARQRQADLEMKRFSKYVMAFNLVLAITTFALGGLLMSSQNAVTATQRFSPDAVHNDALSIKGKTFYVTNAERDQYFFNQQLFAATAVVTFLIIGAELYLFRSKN